MLESILEVGVCTSPSPNMQVHYQASPPTPSLLTKYPGVVLNGA